MYAWNDHVQVSHKTIYKKTYSCFRKVLKYYIQKMQLKLGIINLYIEEINFKQIATDIKVKKI